MAFNDIWAQINYLYSALQTQEKGKFSSQPENSISCKIKSINTISSLINNGIPKISAGISSRNDKVLDESILQSNNNKEK